MRSLFLGVVVVVAACSARAQTGAFPFQPSIPAPGGSDGGGSVDACLKEGGDPGCAMVGSVVPALIEGIDFGQGVDDRTVVCASTTGLDILCHAADLNVSANELSFMLLNIDSLQLHNADTTGQWVDIELHDNRFDFSSLQDSATLTLQFGAALDWTFSGAGAQGPNGSAGVPAFGFATDPDTGWYLPSTGVLGATAAGTLRLSIGASSVTSTVRHLGPDGTTSLPSYGFSGDADMGMTRSGTSLILQTSSSSSNRMTLFAGGLQVPSILQVGSQFSISDVSTTVTMGTLSDNMAWDSGGSSSFNSDATMAFTTTDGGSDMTMSPADAFSIDAPGLVTIGSTGASVGVASSTSDVQLTAGDDILMVATDDVSITVGGDLATITTGSGQVTSRVSLETWGAFILPQRVSSGTYPSAAPTCDATTFEGSVYYRDNTADAVAGAVCLCGGNGSNVFAWRILGTTTACPP